MNRQRTPWWIGAGCCAGLVSLGCGHQPTLTSSTPNPANTIEARQGDEFLFFHQVPPVFADEAGDLTVDLPVHDRTDAPISFEEPTASCSCSGVTLDRRHLLPGEEATLSISINLRARVGPQRFSVALVEKTGRRWRYEIGTQVHERVRFDAPNGVLHLGTMEPGASVVQEVKLVTVDKRPDAFPTDWSFKVDREDLEIHPGAAGRAEKLDDGCYACTVPLTVKHKAPAEPGFYHGTVLCEYTSDGKMHVARLQVTGNVASVYEMNPKYVVFDSTHGEMLPRRVMVRRTDGKPVVFHACKVSSSAVEVEVEKVGSGEAAVLVLSVGTVPLEGPVSGEVTLRTDHELQSSLKVPFAVLTKEKRR